MSRSRIPQASSTASRLHLDPYCHQCNQVTTPARLHALPGLARSLGRSTVSAPGTKWNRQADSNKRRRVTHPQKLVNAGRLIVIYLHGGGSINFRMADLT